MTRNLARYSAWTARSQEEFLKDKVFVSTLAEMRALATPLPRYSIWRWRRYCILWGMNAELVDKMLADIGARNSADIWILWRPDWKIEAARPFLGGSAAEFAVTGTCYILNEKRRAAARHLGAVEVRGTMNWRAILATHRRVKDRELTRALIDLTGHNVASLSGLGLVAGSALGNSSASYSGEAIQAATLSRAGRSADVQTIDEAVLSAQVGRALQVESSPVRDFMRRVAMVNQATQQAMQQARAMTFTADPAAIEPDTAAQQVVVQAVGPWGAARTNDNNDTFPQMYEAEWPPLNNVFPQRLQIPAVDPRQLAPSMQASRETEMEYLRRLQRQSRTGGHDAITGRHVTQLPVASGAAFEALTGSPNDPSIRIPVQRILEIIVHGMDEIRFDAVQRHPGMPVANIEDFVEYLLIGARARLMQSMYTEGTNVLLNVVELIPQIRVRGIDRLEGRPVWRVLLEWVIGQQTYGIDFHITAT